MAFSRSRRTVRTALAASLGGLCLTGCVSGQSGTDYDRYSVGVPAHAVHGTLVGVRPVNIEGARSGAGATAGAVTGGVLLGSAGDGRGESLALGVIGAVFGGLLGAGIEESATASSGFEYTIDLEDGDTVVIVQADEHPVGGVGQPVRILYGDRARVQPVYDAHAPGGR